jgi:hypothetical protein
VLAGGLKLLVGAVCDLPCLRLGQPRCGRGGQLVLLQPAAKVGSFSSYWLGTA